MDWLTCFSPLSLCVRVCPLALSPSLSYLQLSLRPAGLTEEERNTHTIRVSGSGRGDTDINTETWLIVKAIDPFKKLEWGIGKWGGGSKKRATA